VEDILEDNEPLFDWLVLTEGELLTESLGDELLLVLTLCDSDTLIDDEAVGVGGGVIVDEMLDDVEELSEALLLVDEDSLNDSLADELLLRVSLSDFDKLAESLSVELLLTLLLLELDSVADGLGVQLLLVLVLCDTDVLVDVLGDELLLVLTLCDSDTLIDDEPVGVGGGVIVDEILDDVDELSEALVLVDVD